MGLPAVKALGSAADKCGAMIDNSLLEHWQRKRAAREQVRAALPASWRDDPRPQMQEVCETYIETMLQINASSRVISIGEDDR